MSEGRPHIPGVGGLIALAALAGGVALLVSGHLSGSLPAVLIPLALTFFMVGFNTVGLRSLERDIPKLIQEMNGILGSTLSPALLLFRLPTATAHNTSACRHGLRTFPRISRARRVGTICTASDLPPAPRLITSARRRCANRGMRGHLTRYSLTSCSRTMSACPQC